MTDRDAMDMRAWASRAFEGEPVAGSVGDDLARAHAGLRRRRVRVAGATSAGLAVGSVAAVLAAAAIIPTSDGGRSGEDPAGPVAGVVPLDYGPLPAGPDRDFMLRVCSGTGAPRSEDSVASARVLDGPTGLTPVMLGAPEGDDRAAVCTDTSFSAVQGDRLPTPTAEDPILAVQSHRREIIGQIAKPGYWSTGGVYAVADTVDRVEVRVAGDGVDEPWRSAPAHDGFVFWATWFNPDEYAAGEQLRVEWRAYDIDGELIDPAVLPERSRTISAPGPMRPDYAQVRDLLFQVTAEHLDPEGEHLGVDDGRSGFAHGSRWRAIVPDFEWRNQGEPGVGAVSVAIENGAEVLTDGIQGLCASGTPYVCEERDLEGGGSAWVLEGKGGYFRVVHVQPDGEAVAVSIIPEGSWFDDKPRADIDIPVDDLLDLVTDERLDLPD